MAKFVSRKTVKRNSFKEMAEETWNRRVESTCGIDVWTWQVESTCSLGTL